MEKNPELILLPFVIESNGLLHPKSKQFLKWLANKCADMRRLSPKVMYNFFLKSVSITLQRNIAKSINSRLATCLSNIEHEDLLDADLIDDRISLTQNREI